MDLLSYIPILKETNPRLVLGHIRAGTAVTRAEIARVTGLHPSTITRIVASLIEEGLVRENGERENDVGRKPIVLSVVGKAVHIIGVAIESTFVAGVLVDLAATILDKIEIPFPPDADFDVVMEKVEYVVDGLLGRAEKRKITVVGIGAAVHGIVDSSRGLSVFAPAIGWKNVPLGQIMEQKYGLPIRMENNARAMALGELWFGQGRDVQDLLAVKVGQAIGAGIIVGGQLFHGNAYSAGEIGHTTVVPDGPLCKCGNYGCLETVASIEAVTTRLRVMLKRGDAASLSALIGNNPDELSFKALCYATACGDKFVLQMWKKAASYLGLAIANAINIINPAKVLIGGDILPVVDYLLPKIREIVETRVFETLKSTLRIEPVGLGVDSVAIGAATLVLKEFFE